MTIIYILLALLMLAFIIIVHELGHYTVGRLCGVGIEEFSVGFGPKIWQKEKNGILYSIRAIVVGGYVRFTGEDEDSDDPRAFNNQAVWKRFLTVLAGPAMNLVLAYVVAVIYLASYGLYDYVPKVSEVIPETPAAVSGLMDGDIITAVDGEALTYDGAGYQHMTELLSAHSAEDTIALTVLRGDETLTIDTGLYPGDDGLPKMGIYIGTANFPMPIGEAFAYGGTLTVRLVGQMLTSLKDLVFHGEGIDQVSGTVGIVSEVSKTMNQGFDMVLYWMLIISANLGIVNLLPLPALDGGRLVFLIVEGIRRKPIPRDKEGMVHFIGLMAFFALFIVLTWHDIVRIVSGH